MNDRFDELRQQYGCGPVQFSGADEALYNRHLLFDDVIDPFKATPREQFEAMARSLRDVISQRWLLTEKTYEQKNPKRVYYLSMEFLLGRSLVNNAINAQLAEIVLELVRGKPNVDPALIETEPDAGPGQRRPRASGRLLPGLHGHPRAAWHGLRPALRVRHLQADHPGRLASRAARQLAAPARSLGGGTAGGSGRSEAELLLRAAGRCAASDRRTAVGAARHPVRPAGDRLWGQDDQHAASLGGGHPGLFRLPTVQPGRLRGRAGRDAGLRVLDAGPLSRRLDQHGTGTALPAGIFPRRLLAGRSGAAVPPQPCGLERAPREGRNPAQRHPSCDGRSRADAHPARRGAAWMGSGLGPHATHARVHQPYAVAGGTGEVAARVVRGAAAAPSADHRGDQPAPAR